MIAVKKFKEGKFLAVVYKETGLDDGFVVTAYFTKKLNLKKEVIKWQAQ